MTEYLNRLNEFVGNTEFSYSYVDDPDQLSEVLEKILNHPFIKFHNNIVHDIAGHTYRYIEKAHVFLIDKVNKMLRIAFIIHMIISIIIVSLFMIYITRQIKQQLYLMDVLMNIIFSVPLPVYRSSTKLQT